MSDSNKMDDDLKNAVNVDSAGSTSTNADNAQSTGEKDEKIKWYEYLVYIGLFIYNSFVFVHNIRMGGGWLWLIIAVIVNVCIVRLFVGKIKKLINKRFPTMVNKKIAAYTGYGFFGILFFIGLLIQLALFKPIISYKAVELTNQILEERHIKNVHCTDVTIHGKIAGVYIATAFFSNGSTGDISIIIDSGNIIVMIN